MSNSSICSRRKMLAFVASCPVVGSVSIATAALPPNRIQEPKACSPCVTSPAIVRFADTKNRHWLSPEDFGASGNEVDDDQVALVKMSRALSTSPRSWAHMRGRYRVGRRERPAFVEISEPSFAKEGAITVISPENIGIDWADGSIIVIDNLDNYQRGDQYHGLVVRNVVHQGAGFQMTGTAAVRWRSRPSIRSQGDGFRFYGYPSTEGSTSTGDRLLRGLSLEHLHCTWSPQAGVLFIGVADSKVGRVTAIETLADQVHWNSCNNVSVGDVLAERCGDDAAAFVCYYSDSGTPTPIYGQVGIDPFALPSLSRFSNEDCTLGAVMMNGSTNAVRLAGSRGVRVGKVIARGGGAGVTIDGGFKDEHNSWTYQLSTDSHIDEIYASDVNIGLLVRTFGQESSIAKINSSSNITVGTFTANKCKALGIQLEGVDGIRMGDVVIRDCPISISTSTFNCESLVIQDSSRPSVISGEATNLDGLNSASLQLSNLNLHNVECIRAALEFHDVHGCHLGTFSSLDSPTNGLYLTRCSHIDVSSLSILNWNRSHSVTQNRGLLLYNCSYVEVGSRTVLTTDHADDPAIEIGGGTAKEVPSHILVKSFAKPNQRPKVLIQGGPYAPVDVTIGD